MHAGRYAARVSSFLLHIERDLLHINVVRYLNLKWYEKLIIMLVKLLTVVDDFLQLARFQRKPNPYKMCI